MAGELLYIVNGRGGSAVLLGLLLVILPGLVFAQTSANTNVMLNAQVLMGLSVSSSGGTDGTGNLDFGLVTTGNTSTIDAKASPSASLYSVGGSTGAAMTVSYTSPAATLSDSSGNQLSFVPQVVGAQTSTSQSTASDITSGSQVVMGPSNSYFIWVGGTISVPAGQVGGTYTGMFNLTIAY